MADSGAWSAVCCWVLGDGVIFDASAASPPLLASAARCTDLVGQLTCEAMAQAVRRYPVLALAVLPYACGGPPRLAT